MEQEIEKLKQDYKSISTQLEQQLHENHQLKQQVNSKGEKTMSKKLKKLIELGWKEELTNQLRSKNGMVVNSTPFGILFGFSEIETIFEIRKGEIISFVLDDLGQLNFHISDNDIVIPSKHYMDVYQMVKAFKIEYQQFSNSPQDYGEQLQEEINAKKRALEKLYEQQAALRMYDFLLM